PEAATGDLGVVDEEVLPAVVGADEAVALRIAEPLDGAGCHDGSSYLFCERVKEGARAVGTRSRFAARLARLSAAGTRAFARRSRGSAAAAAPHPLEGDPGGEGAGAVADRARDRGARGAVRGDERERRGERDGPGEDRRAEAQRRPLAAHRQVEDEDRHR